MAYAEKVLQPGETIAYRGNLHWVIYLTGLVLSLASLADGWVRPRSSAGVPRTRIASRAETPIFLKRSFSCAAVQPVLRYSTTFGSCPAARIAASALRDVPQAGL